MNAHEPPFYGKYRGVVTDNDDTLGRVRARVIDVYGAEPSPWALPAVPYAGPGVGLYLIPPVGALVWFEFEHGDPEYPVWSGCFWAEGQLPATAPAKKVLKTDVGTLTFDDSPSRGGITIETARGMKIRIDTGGIEIDAGVLGRINLTQTKVSINGDALEVT